MPAIVPDVVAIIPAYNEGPRIGAVLGALAASSQVRRILVVDDGSTDDTANVARAFGAEVLAMPQNGGKGEAMRAGLRASTESVVLFLDADLVGLKPGHVARLLAPVVNGSCVMAVGVHDYNNDVWFQLQRALPRISGQRAVLRRVLQMVPDTFWRGFRIEAGINALANRMGRVCDVTLYELGYIPKWQKGNEPPAMGFLRAAKMIRDVLVATEEARHL